MSSSSPRVLTTHEDGVTTITLNTPERLNAVGTDMLQEITKTVSEQRRGRRVIVLRGAGRAFCSGADLSRDDEAEGTGSRSSSSTLEAANELVAALVATPTPVVAVVHGAAAGVGVPIALAADVVVASTAAYFQLAFARVGLMPDGGATALVAASVGRATALRLALLADRLGAEEAAALGLIGRLAAPEELEEAVDTVVSGLRDGPSAALARTKLAINAVTLTELPAAFLTERDGQEVLSTSPDFAEGAAAFLGKRRPVFTDDPFDRPV